MKKLILLIAAIFLIGALRCEYTQAEAEKKTAQLPQMDWSRRLTVSVVNPGNFTMTDVPVIVSVQHFKLPEMSFLEMGHFRVIDPATGEMPLYQVDDLDGDGRGADEIVFLTTLKPGEEKTYFLDFFKGFKAWPQQERFTDATNMPGWESELFGYRSYGAFIIDMFGKYQTNPGLRLKTFYNESNKQIYNYHVDSPLGMDILHVGPTIGLGGIALKTGDSVEMPGSGALECQVLVSGPVRSIVTQRKDNWQTSQGTFSISRTATIYAHHFETQIHDEITVVESKNSIGKLGTGMKKEADMKYVSQPENGRFLLWFNQPMYDIGEMGFGMLLQSPEKFVLEEDDANFYYLLKQTPETGAVLTYDFVAFGAWQRAGFVHTSDEFSQLADKIQSAQIPPTVKIVGLEKR